MTQTGTPPRTRPTDRPTTTDQPYTLYRFAVPTGDDQTRGAVYELWGLYRGAPPIDREPAECVHVARAEHLSTHRIREAQRSAEQHLRRNGVRVTGWTRNNDGTYTATTGPFLGQWHVVVYADRDGNTWTREGDTGWWKTYPAELGPAPRRQAQLNFADEYELDLAFGPLVPVKVSNLEELVAEAAMLRGIATYYRGDPECFEAECEDYDDDRDIEKGVTRNEFDVPTCTHLAAGVEVATSADAIAMSRLRYELDSQHRAADAVLNSPTPKDFTDADREHCQTIKEVLDSIEYAIKPDDE